MRAVVLLLLVIFLSATSSRASDVKTVQNLDLNRYLGTWHEVARFPLFFQRGCSQSKATYALINPTKISVHNRCIKDGKLSEVKGDAVVKEPGKLAVKFSNFMPFRAPYWVLWVDGGYQTAVVGGPNAKNGWILSRKAKRSRASLVKALRVFKENGYDLDRLIWSE